MTPNQLLSPEDPGPSPQGLESSVSEGLGVAVVGPDPQTCLQSPWAGEPSFPHNPHDFSYFQETCSPSSSLHCLGLRGLRARGRASQHPAPCPHPVLKVSPAH